MIGRQLHSTERPELSRSNGGSISVALQERRDGTCRGTRRVSNQQCPRSGTSAHRRRGLAYLVECLEDRSVPSGLGNLSLSAIPTAVQSTAPVLQDFVPPSNLGARVVAPSSNSPTLALPVGGIVATTAGTVLDAVSLGLIAIGGSPAPLVRPIDLALGSQTTGTGNPDAGAADAWSGPLIDVPGVISLNVGLPSLVHGVDSIDTGAVAVSVVVSTLDGVVGGGGLAGAGGGISVAGNLGLGGMGASISIPGVGSTLGGLSIDVNVSLSPPLDLTGGFPDPVPPSIPTNPILPGGSVGIRISPTSPILLDETGGSSASPPFEVGSSRATSTASTPDTLPQGDGHATEAQSASFAPNAGSAAISAVATLTTASPVSVTTSGFAGVEGGNAVAVGGGRDDAPILAGPSSAGPESLARPGISPAELLPRDLEGLERALGQLLRRFDGMGEDLAEWLTQISTLEMLLAAGMVAVAGDVIRRWERSRQLANSQAPMGSSSRPSPFYRARGYRFGRRGPGAITGGSANF